MKKYIAIVMAMLSLATVAAAQTPGAKPPVKFTEDDRAAALKYLEETKADFMKEVSGLSDKQLSFRPAEKRWTIAEVAEHIILSETALRGLIAKMIETPAPAGKDDYRAKDLGVRLAITNRSQRFNAPEFLKPASKFKTRDELLSNFEKERNATIEWVKGTKADLRGHFFDNAMMGVIDAHQWVLFLAGHSDRHLAQLKEVKTEKKYPKK